MVPRGDGAVRGAAGGAGLARGPLREDGARPRPRPASRAFRACAVCSAAPGSLFQALFRGALYPTSGQNKTGLYAECRGGMTRALLDSCVNTSVRTEGVALPLGQRLASHLRNVACSEDLVLNYRCVRPCVRLCLRALKLLAVLTLTVFRRLTRGADQGAEPAGWTHRPGASCSHSVGASGAAPRSLLAGWCG